MMPLLYKCLEMSKEDLEGRIRSEMHRKPNKDLRKTALRANGKGNKTQASMNLVRAGLSKMPF